MPARNEITKDTLDRLARLRADGPRVLSLYLNLDPKRFAIKPARASEIRSLIDEAGRQIESGERAHDERGQLRSDLERVEAHLKGGRFTEGARAHAVFCCSSLELFETLSLPNPVEGLVKIDETPFIAPLVETGPPGSWCVALINRRVARIFRGDASNMTEEFGVADPVHGRHSQGGLSQARYQRSVEKDVDEHLRRAARSLLSQYQHAPFEGLLIAAPEELRGQLTDRLHAYVRERLVGFMSIDVETASAAQVTDEAAKLIKEHQAKVVQARLEKLRAEIGSGGRAAAGAVDVLQSLYERRVETLLFAEPRTAIPGGICPRCGMMLTDRAATCPVDEIALEPRDDLLEDAVHAAVEQDADVVPVAQPDLRPLGGIAALLRF